MPLLTPPGARSLFGGLARQVGAEFRKIAAARMTLVFVLALPAGTYLFAYELYHVERMVDHMPVPNAYHSLAVLFFASWKTLLFQLALTAFAAFWTTLDSQYGMIRVACSQPVSRSTYLLGKWLGIGGHVVLLSAVVLCPLVWSAVYTGFRGMGPTQWWAICRFAVEAIVFALSVRERRDWRCSEPRAC